MSPVCIACLFTAIIPVGDAIRLANTSIREERTLEIRGQVMGITEEGSFSIRDASGSAFIHSSATNQISVGDIVTVRGEAGEHFRRVFARVDLPPRLFR